MGTSTASLQLTVTAESDTALSAIASAMAAERPSAPMWSLELADQDSRYLATSHPLKPAGTAIINEPMDRSGGGYLAEASGGLSAFRGWNPSSTDLLTGKAGPYASDWHPDTGWWLSYGTTGWNPWAQTIINYNPVNDEFRCWSALAENDLASSLWPTSPDTGFAYGEAHNFAMSTICTSNRRLYRALRNFDPTGQTTNVVHYRLAWASLDNPGSRGLTNAIFATSDSSLKLPIIYFPEMGSQGSILCLAYSRSNLRQWWVLDIASDQFVTGNTLYPLMPTVRLYSRPAMCYCNGAVYYAHHDAQTDGTSTVREFSRMLPDGSVEPLAAPPVDMNGEAQWYETGPLTFYQAFEGKHTNLAALGTTIYAFWPGPVSSSGAVYAYDTIGDSWSLVDTMYPWADPSLGVEDSYANRASFSAAAVESDGVVAIAQQFAPYEARAYIWKP